MTSYPLIFSQALKKMRHGLKIVSKFIEHDYDSTVEFHTYHLLDGDVYDANGTLICDLGSFEDWISDYERSSLWRSFL